MPYKQYKTKNTKRIHVELDALLRRRCCPECAHRDSCKSQNELCGRSIYTYTGTLRASAICIIANLSALSFLFVWHACTRTISCIRLSQLTLAIAGGHPSESAVQHRISTLDVCGPCTVAKPMWNCVYILLGIDLQCSICNVHRLLSTGG